MKGGDVQQVVEELGRSPGGRLELAVALVLLGNLPISMEGLSGRESLYRLTLRSWSTSSKHPG